MDDVHEPSVIVGVADRVGKSTQSRGSRAASRHEARLLWTSRPSLYLLLRGARQAGAIRRVPRLGWVFTDPLLCHEILNDADHFTLLGEGGVGHLWAQVLGDHVSRLFDGAGHADLRSRTRDLFTERSAHSLVDRVMGPSLLGVRDELAAGGTVDTADLSRVLVGRMMADMLGMRGPGGDSDAWLRSVFASGERLAALAPGSAASTELSAETIAAARLIIDELTADLPSAFASAPASTLLGRCRELGVTLEEARGLASLLMVAGTEMAATAMTRTVALLHDTGQTSRLLAAPDLLAGAVREGLRVTTPAVERRRAGLDVDLRGEHRREAVRHRRGLRTGQPATVVRRRPAPVPGRPRGSGRDVLAAGRAAVLWPAMGCGRPALCPARDDPLVFQPPHPPDPLTP